MARQKERESRGLMDMSSDESFDIDGSDMMKQTQKRVVKGNGKLKTKRRKQHLVSIYVGEERS